MAGRLWIALLALLALFGASAPTIAVPSLRAAAATYYANVSAVAAYTGRETAMEYYRRLVDDGDLLAQPVPAGYDPAIWSSAIQNASSLDVSLAEQLVARSPVPLASIRGLGETVIRSSQDGTMQPVAVYVPSTYVPGNPAALVVFLHGREQPETSLLAPPFMQALAEENGAIVVAPYGRGYYSFRGASQQDVYDAFDAAKAAFSIDARRQFLAGYSMGGFAVFELAPVRRNAWAAVMSISGGLVSPDAPRAVAAMRNVPVYVLTGAADDVVPTQFPTVAAAYLSREGLAVSFYSQPGGSHRLSTLDPILRLAWADMLHQVVRSQPSGGSAVLPPEAPTRLLKTFGIF